MDSQEIVQKACELMPLEIKNDSSKHDAFLSGVYAAVAVYKAFYGDDLK